MLLPDGIEEIGSDAFRMTALGSVVTPPSVRTIRQGAFCKCPCIQSVTLNEGLEVLGTDEHPDGTTHFGVFEESLMRSVKLPSTLKRIEYSAFKGCRCLSDIRLPEGLESIGPHAFALSGLENVRIPSSVRIKDLRMLFH